MTDDRGIVRSVRAQLVSPPMLVALFALLLAAGGVTYAAIPDAQGTITACYETKGGDLRIIDKEAGAGCDSKETELSWNEQGSPGLSGLQRIAVDSAIDSDSRKNVTATCPTGKKVVGGGADTIGAPLGLIPNQTTDIVLITAGPLFSDLASYTVGAIEDEPTAQDWGITAIAICAFVSS